MRSSINNWILPIATCRIQSWHHLQEVIGTCLWRSEINCKAEELSSREKNLLNRETQSNILFGIAVWKFVLQHWAQYTCEFVYACVCARACNLLELWLFLRNIIINGYLTETVFALSGTKDHFYFVKIKKFEWIENASGGCALQHSFLLSINSSYNFYFIL